MKASFVSGLVVRDGRAVQQLSSLAKPDLLSGLANGRVSLPGTRRATQMIGAGGRPRLTSRVPALLGLPRSAQIGVPRHRSVNRKKPRFPALPCRSTPTSETRPLDELQFLVII